MASRETAIVTGAGTGIGRELVRMLAGAGYGVTLVGRRAGKLAEAARDVTGRVPEAELLTVPADVAAPDAAERIVAQTLARWERVDVLVNNAGGVELAPIAATTEDLLARTFAVNAYGPLRLIARLWDVFVRQRSGRVVNVSSMATIDPFPGLAVYAAAKSALESLARSVVNEGRDSGIRAWNVAPGAVETAMLRGLWSAEDLPPERTLDPAAVAGVVMECIRGDRDDEPGRTIAVPSP